MIQIPRGLYCVALGGTLAVVGCTADAPDIEVRSAQLEFDLVSTVTAVRRSVQVSNVGFGTLEITDVIFDTMRSGPFTLVGAVGRNVEPGRTAALDVEFLPSLPGPVTSRMLIRSNDPDEPEVVVQLVGEGIELEPCSYVVVPRALNFGFVGVGDTSRRAFEIRNNGADDCLLTSARIEPGSDASFSLPDGDVMNEIIPIAGAATIEVEYTPTVSGSYTGGVEFSISSDTSPVEVVSLSGYDVAKPPGIMDLDPDAVDFGNVQVGTQQTRTVFVRNVGDGPLTLEGVFPVAPFSDRFTFDLSDTQIPPNGTAALTITFAPDDLVAQRAGLEVRSTDPAVASMQISIIGMGATTTLVVDPDVLSFGNVVVNTVKALSIRLANTSAVDATLTSRGQQNVTLCTSSNPDQSTFCLLLRDRQISAEGTFQLRAGEETTLEIQFNPVIAGTRERGSFILALCENSACETEIRLDGLGIESGFRCNPPALDFGQVAAATCRTQTVTCENIANAQVTVVTWGPVSSGGIPTSTDFEVEPSRVHVLNEGDTIDVDITYCPKSPGNDTGTLGIETDNRDTRLRNIFVPLTGTS